MPSVTMSGEEYDALRDRAKDAWDEVGRLTAELVKAREGALSQGEQQCARLARMLLPIAQFAVGQLPPETTRHWPADKLAYVAAHLTELPDFDENDRILSIEFKEFVIKVRDCERERAARGEPARAEPDEFAGRTGYGRDGVPE